MPAPRPLRIVVLAVSAAVAAAVLARFAFARTDPSPIGTGVVVIDTNLAFEGGAAAGTGMVLTSSGEVLTNNHVIRGATAIRIVLPDSRRSYAARVVGYDVSDDVAVLRAVGAVNLRTISVGKSSSLALGERVTAVGNAGGTGSLASVAGTVTGIARSITVGDERGGSERLSGLIETNAALEPGDSGGPLLDAARRVVGMDTAASASAGVSRAARDGFAIPIDRALTIVEEVVEKKVSATVHVGGTAFLGVELASRFDGSPGPGAAVAAVVPGGPADRAGLAAGDVITAVDGRAVTSPTSLTALVLARKPGARILVVYEDATGGSSKTTVTLAAGPPQ